MSQTTEPHHKSFWKKLLLAVVLLALAAIAFLLINPLTGNPVSKLLAEKTAKAHIAERYPSLDLRLERVVYNFKDGCYCAHVASPDNVDMDFTVYTNGWGQLLSDDYERQITSGWNTAVRLDEEYRRLADAVLESDGFPYACDIGFGELLLGGFSIPADTVGCLNMADLEPGKEYDILALAKNSGKLTVYIDRDTVTVEEAARILLELKSRMDDAGVPFHCIDFTLQYPRPEKEGARPDGTVMALDFLYTDIYEEGMADRMQAAYEAALAYYQAQDTRKDAEPTEW